MSEFAYKPMPTPPDSVIQYARRKISDPNLEMKENYWREKPDVISWFKQIDIWRAMNLSNYKWLQVLKEKGDTSALIPLSEYDREDWWVFGYKFIQEVASYSTIPEVI